MDKREGQGWFTGQPLKCRVTLPSTLCLSTYSFPPPFSSSACQRKKRERQKEGSQGLPPTQHNTHTQRKSSWAARACGTWPACIIISLRAGLPHLISLFYYHLYVYNIRTLTPIESHSIRKEFLVLLLLLLPLESQLRHFVMMKNYYR